MILSKNQENQPNFPPLGVGGHNILMIRPVNFGFNEQTATSNAFQNVEFGKANATKAQETALLEFDTIVGKLRAVGVNVIVIEDTLELRTQDSIFPNNWISFHEDGTLITYPMQAENRRQERREDIIQLIEKQFAVNRKVDLSFFEKDEMYLEGTGSMVLDRQNKIAYACLSPRTHMVVLEKFSLETGYKIVEFDAVDGEGRAIYHTNVLMCIAKEFVVICLDSIPNQIERKKVIESIEKSDKEIIEITLDQMNHFAGNMLEVVGENNVKYLIMSSSAYNSLNQNQIEKLEKHSKIIHSDLSMIEGNGGGSARCMMAEVCMDVRN
jgi:hypothetical protein